MFKSRDLLPIIVTAIIVFGLAIATVVDNFGRLDVVFNNVGIPTPRLGNTLEQHTAADFERLFAVNVGGVFYGCKHAVLRFKAQETGGAIVNTG